MRQARTTSARWFVLALALPFAAMGQTSYKCKTASGSTTYSDRPCPGGATQEKTEYVAPPPQQYPPAQSSNARMLDAKVAEALGSGDFPRAKGLAVTPEHWQMIADAEKALHPRLGKRTEANARADASSSRECREAQRSHEVEASSIRRDIAAINAAGQRMQAACSGKEARP